MPRPSAQFAALGVISGLAAAVGLVALMSPGDGQSHAPSLGHAAAGDLGAALERMTRALERLEARLPTPGPTLAPRSGEARVDPGQTQIAEMLARIAERLDRLGPAPGAGFTPETSRDRSREQEERLRSLEEDDPQGVHRRHFMFTGRDLLERYGAPDRASYWTGMTARWVYYLDGGTGPERQVPSTGPRAVFELLDGYVTAAFVEPKR